MKSIHNKSKKNYSRDINEIDEILEVLVSSDVMHPFGVQNLRNLVDNRLHDIYTENKDEKMSNFEKKTKRIPSIYSSLDFLDHESCIDYERSFDDVSITTKGKIKIENGGFKIDQDVENANIEVKISAPKRIRRAERISVISLIIAIVSTLISIISIFW